MPNNGGNLLAFGEDVIGAYGGGSGGSGGHVIINSSDVELPQEEGLKFSGGLNATDDGTNDRTVVTDNYEIIPWTTWQDYTAAQKAQHPNAIITDAPDCDGILEIENLHLAWTNPSPTASFAGQTVTLDTDDYDFYVVYARFADTVPLIFSEIIPKGQNGYIRLPYAYPSNLISSRTFSPVYSTQYKTIQFESAVTNGTVNNAYCIPYQIFTGKYTQTAKIKAIAHDVSTSASKCMMSDGQTSVETAVNAKTETFVVPLNGTTDSSGNYYTGINKTSVPPMCGVLFDTDSTSYDGLYIPFISPVTAGLYLHVTNFAQVSQVGVTVKGNLHITRRI